MTYGVVNGCADGLWKAFVIQRGRNHLLHIDHVIVTDLIKLLGRDAWNNIGRDHFEDFGGEAAGDAHDLDFFCGFNMNGHRASRSVPEGLCALER